MQFLKLNSSSQLGVRVEWTRVRHEPGGWQVQDMKILGTDAGEVRVLLTLTKGDQSLLAEAKGEWVKGEEVSLSFEKYVVFSK